jgi:ribonuclease HI
MKILRIYTDGACSGNQNETNIGGWGAVLEYGDVQKELHGGDINTTNNKMELTAVIEALSALKKNNQTIQIFSDSSYVMDCFRKKWYVTWQKNGWMTSKKTPVENRELWERLIELVSAHSVSFYRVKGHVDLDHPNTQINKLYQKFKEWNSSSFTMDDFRYVTKMNNRADELANIGMDAFR